MYRDATKERQAASRSLIPRRVRLPSRDAWYRMDPAERVQIAEASDGLIDPRVGKHGGYRRSSKDNYDFPGMIDDTTWRRGPVHKATSYYGCSLCGTGFSGPHAYYCHAAKVHGR